MPGPDRPAWPVTVAEPPAREARGACRGPSFSKAKPLELGTAMGGSPALSGPSCPLLPKEDGNLHAWFQASQSSPWTPFPQQPAKTTR